MQRCRPHSQKLEIDARKRRPVRPSHAQSGSKIVATFREICNILSRNQCSHLTLWRWRVASLSAIRPTLTSLCLSRIRVAGAMRRHLVGSRQIC